MDLRDEIVKQADLTIAKYPEKRSATLMLLHLILEEKGHISNDAMEWVASKLDIKPIQVYEVVTFYPMFRQQPVGKKHVKVCRTLSCALKGGYATCKNLQEKLGCGLGKTTEDGEYSIEFVECIASCHTAPVVQVNDKLYHNIDPNKVEEFVAGIDKDFKTEAKV